MNPVTRVLTQVRPQLAAILLLAAVATTFVTPAAPALAAPVTCTCVTYLQKIGAIPAGIGSAADAGPVLQRNGFRAWNGPASPPSGAIMVFPRGALGANSTHGHIAQVASARFDTARRQYAITVRHAGWSGGTAVYSSVCSNVTQKVFYLSSLNSSGVAYYVR